MKQLLLLLLLLLFGVCLTSSARPVKGSVMCGKKEMSGVLVTDGYNFATTDAEGAFELETDDRAWFVYLVTPTGYLAPTKQGFPVFYRELNLQTKRYDFELQAWNGTETTYELLAISDPQPKTEAHFKRLCTEVIPPLKAETKAKAAQGTQQAAIILGDIVWDSPELFGRVKKQFGTLDIPIYPVIGNHDHDLKKTTDDESTANYRVTFGPTYYAFDMGSTHYIVLDDIIYYGAKKYDEQIDSTQLQWVEKYAKHLPAGSRICIAMHAPLMKSWRENEIMKSATGILDALKAYDLHFISGHTHINSNFDVREGVIEHNVAQICGNLWHDPINSDGTPKGFQLFQENKEGFEWHYQSLGQPADKQMKIWNLGEVAPWHNQVVAKIWNWDSHWTVVWYEDGLYRGAMQRVALADPDYTARLDSLQAAGHKLAKAQKPRPLNFYFTARPAVTTREIKVVATDRFGGQYTELIKIKRP